MNVLLALVPVAATAGGQTPSTVYTPGDVSIIESLDSIYGLDKNAIAAMKPFSASDPCFMLGLLVCSVGRQPPHAQ